MRVVAVDGRLERGALPDCIWNSALDFRALLQLKLREKRNAGVREDVSETCEAAGIQYLIMHTNDSNAGTQSSQSGRQQKLQAASSPSAHQHYIPRPQPVHPITPPRALAALRRITRPDIDRAVGCDGNRTVGSLLRGGA